MRERWQSSKRHSQGGVVGDDALERRLLRTLLHAMPNFSRIRVGPKRHSALSSDLIIWRVGLPSEQNHTKLPDEPIKAGNHGVVASSSEERTAVLACWGPG